MKVITSSMDYTVFTLQCIRFLKAVYIQYKLKRCSKNSNIYRQRVNLEE